VHRARRAAVLRVESVVLTHDLCDELSDQIHLFLNSVTLYDVIEGRVKGSDLVAGGNAV
jgi:hypothetical protein